MGLRINTNIMSLKAQRNLGQSTQALNRALQRLASGSRINRAGDDAAGLAVSEGLQSQVRGMRQAIRNANDSFGFLATAEGALGEMTNILQRLRELSIQAANGTISSTDRSFLDAEKDQLLEEMNRIANGTNFNGTNLIDGSFTTIDLQVGVSKGETISFTIGDARTSSLGAIASVSGSQNSITDTTANLMINNTAISETAASDDTISFTGNSYSAVAIANKINEKAGQTGVRADILDSEVTINDITFGSFTGTLNAGDLVINGVSITGSNVTSIGGLIDAINDQSNASGVSAELVSGSGNDDIKLSTVDGRNITVQIASAANTNGTTFNDAINNTSNISAGTVFAGNTNNLSAGHTETLTGAIKLRSADAISISGAGVSAALGFTATNVSVDLNTAINQIDIGTQSAAQDALAFVDAALDQLFELRANLGAVENRLQSGMNNLSITSENLSAAQSQIRDADIAMETAELTKNQILQQAGIAVLGQANVSQQVALSLLNF